MPLSDYLSKLPKVNVSAADVATLAKEHGKNFSADEAKQFLAKYGKTGCHDVFEDDAMDANHTCYTSVVWAMLTGIKDTPAFYKNYTTLSSESTYSDFQCALWDMRGADESGEGHDCPKPCSSALVQKCIESTIDRELPTTTMITTTTVAGGSSFPWWAWLLIISPLLILGGGLAYYFMGKNKPKKKKRAIKTKAAAPAKAEAPTPAPEPLAAPVAQPLIAPPVYVTPTVSTMPAMYQTIAAPTYAQAAPAAATYVQAAPTMTMPPTTYTTAVPQQGSFVAAPQTITTTSPYPS